MSFDTLKREAVQLERQLEEKVHRFQQLAQRNPVDSAASLAELGGVDAVTAEFDACSRQLHGVVQSAAAAAQSASHRAAATRMETIRTDLQREFHASVATVRRAVERQHLLGGTTGATAPQSAGDTGMDALLRERGHIHNSMNVASSTLAQAEGIRDDLQWQGRGLRNTTGLMASMTQSIPGMNRLVEAIRTRRSRDDQIVAGVMAVCIVFTLWYIFG